MPDPRRTTCRTCGKPASEVGVISWRGKCGGCAKQAVYENIDGLVKMQGEPLRRWRVGMAASVGAVLLDDSPSRGQTRD